MPKMKAVQVPTAGGDLQVVEREVPQAGPGQVRIRVQACGVCHSDVVTKEGQFPGISYPRVHGPPALRGTDPVALG
jgi:D-arabinose 1-dehydrogenase-like Zn-dependent alcohol dehydrogenase